jgi:membrane-associated phospholipid phosphatase
MSNDQRISHSEVGKHRAPWIVVAWIVAISVAAVLDSAVAGFAHQIGSDEFLNHHDWLKWFLKLPGFFGFTVILAVVIQLRHPLRWRASTFLLLCGATSGANQLMKYIAGRTRPYRTLSGYSDLLTPFQLHPFPSFDSKNLCFPSGHAALAFATAASLSILWPRWRWGFYAVATVVAVERVMENAHWFSDAVAAAAMGVGGAWVVRWLWWDRLPKRTPPEDPRGFEVVAQPRTDEE